MIDSRLIFQLLIPIIVGGVLLFLWVWGGKRKRLKKSLSSPYTEALSALINGDKIKAMNKLRQVVKLDTDNLDAYLKLGDIYRDFGNNLQALRVHQSLTVRKSLTNYQKLSIWKSLLQDHRLLKEWNEAIKYSGMITELDRNNVWARKELLEIYKEKGDWDGAVEAAKSIQKQEKKKNVETLALYQIQQGLEYRKKGEERDARIRFKRALKTSINCAAAHYFIGVSYLSEGRKKDAVESWRKFVKTDPKHAYLVFDELEEVLYDLGNFEQSEKIYQEILDLDDGNVSALVALSDLNERKGNREESIRMLRRAINKDNSSLRAKAYLIQMLLGPDASDEIREIIQSLIQSTRRSRKFDCRSCGYHSETPLWICPDCLNENTFLD